MRALVPALVAWLLLAVVGLPHGFAACLGLVGAGLLCAAAGLARREWRWHPVRRLLALTGAALALVGVSGAGTVAQAEIGPLRQLADDGASATIRGTVIVDPKRVKGTGTSSGGESIERGRSARSGPLFTTRLIVREVESRGRRTSVHSKVLVIGDQPWQGIPWHSEVMVRVTLRPPEPGSDVVAVARAKAPHSVSDTGVIERAAEHARGRMRDATAHLPADARALVPALVIGDTSRTPDDLDDAMLATGLTHLSAVSGSNVG